MADLKSLNELLSVAAGVLDNAAAEIRDIPLDPKKDHISKIGHALTLRVSLIIQNNSCIMTLS